MRRELSRSDRGFDRGSKSSDRPPPRGSGKFSDRGSRDRGHSGGRDRGGRDRAQPGGRDRGGRDGSGRRSGRRPDSGSSHHSGRDPRSGRLEEIALRDVAKALRNLRSDPGLETCILKPINSFYRRLQHQAAADEGFGSESVGEGPDRAVKIIRKSADG